MKAGGEPPEKKVSWFLADGFLGALVVLLTAAGDHSDLIVEQGLLLDDDLQTETMVMPFHYSVEQVLESINGRKGQ